MDHTEVVQLLVNHGADVHCTDKVSGTDGKVGCLYNYTSWGVVEVLVCVSRYIQAAKSVCRLLSLQPCFEISNVGYLSHAH